MSELAIPPVARSWERIDNWLAVHAPLSLAFLALALCRRPTSGIST
jgi:hypothetical protein